MTFKKKDITDAGDMVKVSQDNLQVPSVRQIARMIRADWKNKYFGAVPYLEAMRDFDTAKETYGFDRASSIITYFLSNASTYRGGRAKALKALLRLHLSAQTAAVNGDSVTLN